MTARILVIDDHIAVRQGLVQILTPALPHAVFDAAASPEAAIELIDRAPCDIAIVDLSLGDVIGLELIKRIKRKQPKVAVLIYTMHPEQQFGVRALKAGADGYLTKDTEVPEVIRAVKQLLSGRRYISAELADRLAQSVPARAEDAPHERLSNREFVVLRKIAGGKSVSQIASELRLSIKTVSTYRARILSKLELTTTAELLRYALEKGLCE